MNQQFVNIMIKDHRCGGFPNQCPSVLFLRMSSVHFQIWLVALLGSGGDELVENSSFAVSQRGEGQQSREADTEGLNEQAQRHRYPSRDQVLHGTNILSRVLE